MRGRETLVSNRRLLPPSDFADRFRFHVVPRVKKMLMQSGINVAMGLVTWSEAYHELMDVARKFGFSHMPESHQDAFADWLTTVLADEISAAESIADEALALVEKCLRLPTPDAVALVREFAGYVR